MKMWWKSFGKIRDFFRSIYWFFLSLFMSIFDSSVLLLIVTFVWLVSWSFCDLANCLFKINKVFVTLTGSWWRLASTLFRFCSELQNLIRFSFSFYSAEKTSIKTWLKHWKIHSRKVKSEIMEINICSNLSNFYFFGISQTPKSIGLYFSLWTFFVLFYCLFSWKLFSYLLLFAICITVPWKLFWIRL